MQKVVNHAEPHVELYNYTFCHTEGIKRPCFVENCKFVPFPRPYINF